MIAPSRPGNVLAKEVKLVIEMGRYINLVRYYATPLEKMNCLLQKGCSLMCFLTSRLIEDKFKPQKGICTASQQDFQLEKRTHSALLVTSVRRSNKARKIQRSKTVFSSSSQQKSIKFPLAYMHP